MNPFAVMHPALAIAIFFAWMMLLVFTVPAGV